MERGVCRVMGKTLGTYDGWDGDDLTIVFYDFRPTEGVPLASGDLTLSYEKGIFEYYNDDGEVTSTVDALSVLTSI